MCHYVHAGRHHMVGRALVPLATLIIFKHQPCLWGNLLLMLQLHIRRYLSLQGCLFLSFKLQLVMPKLAALLDIWSCPAV